MADLEDDIPLTDEELALAERGSALIAAAMAHPEARAPQTLRESLEWTRTAERPSRRRVSRPRRLLVAPGLGLVAALIVVLIVAVGGPGDRREPPSVLQVAAVTRLPARQAAPVAVAAGGARPHLSAAVEGLAFPDWSGTFDWTTTGRRTDRVGGRAVTTVFYRYQDGTTLGYAIVAGSPLAASAGRDVTRGNARYRVRTRGGRTTVTWTQARHTCVIDAPSVVPTAALVTLAAWGNT